MQIDAIMQAVEQFDGTRYVDVLISGNTEPLGVGKITPDNVQFLHYNGDPQRVPHTVMINGAGRDCVFYLDPNEIKGFVTVADIMDVPDAENE